MSHEIHLIPGSPPSPVRFEAREPDADGEVPWVFLAFCAQLPEATMTIDLVGVHYTVEPMIRALGVSDKPAFALMTSAAGNVLVPIVSLRKVSPQAGSDANATSGSSPDRLQVAVGREIHGGLRIGLHHLLRERPIQAVERVRPEARDDRPIAADPSGIRFGQLHMELSHFRSWQTQG